MTHVTLALKAQRISNDCLLVMAQHDHMLSGKGKASLKRRAICCCTTGSILASICTLIEQHSVRMRTREEQTDMDAASGQKLPQPRREVVRHCEGKALPLESVEDDSMLSPGCGSWN